MEMEKMRPIDSIPGIGEGGYDGGGEFNYDIL
jgi:hypothetical protein